MKKEPFIEHLSIHQANPFSCIELEALKTRFFASSFPTNINSITSPLAGRKKNMSAGHKGYEDHESIHPEQVKRSNEIHGMYSIFPFGITARVAIFLLIFLFVPMVLTGVLIEKGKLIPGENMYLAIPIFFIPLIIPFSRFVSYYLINRDLETIARFCAEIKRGNFSPQFDVPIQKENEDSLIVLQRNLNWMSLNLQQRANTNKERLTKLNNNYRQARKQAFSDPLTGLYNRRYLKNLFTNGKRIQLYNNVSLIYIDCDDFKQVNDTKGHATGDDVLVWLAGCLRESSRVDRDIPLRLGGDEFALLLIDVELEESVAVAKRIQSLYHLKDAHGTTLSMGVASLSCDSVPTWSSIEFLIQHGDRQAYFVKNAGGNNISTNDQLIGVDQEASSMCVRATRKLANLDPLTELPNRYLAKERFEQALTRSRIGGTKLCLLFLDIDDFKGINDLYGHEIGDKYLIFIAQCIKNVLKPEDSLCRLGGDEFLILIENIQSKDDVAPLVMKISDSVRTTSTIDNLCIVATSSIGITLVPDDGEDFDDLCKRADLALSEAKNDGKNHYCFFDPHMAETVNQSMVLMTDMRSAMSKGEMELFYQPQIDIANGQVVGAEALIRWHHPERRLLSPGHFIPLAERNGQIIEIGAWVIDSACRQCADWKSYGIEDLVMAINISPMQIKRDNFVTMVLTAIDRYGLEGKNIELEFTESLLLHNDSKIQKKFNELRKAGIYLAIDDFGTGYSNLNYIKHFNITKLKIDMSFIQGMADNQHDRAIVEAIVKMSKSLGLATVAEGIEDSETVELLRMLQCDTGQGYFWQRPQAAAEFLDYIRSLKIAA